MELGELAVEPVNWLTAGGFATSAAGVGATSSGTSHSLKSIMSNKSGCRNMVSKLSPGGSVIGSGGMALSAIILG